MSKILFFLPIFLFSADSATINSEFFGALTLLPPIVAIILAFLTKDVILSLFIGVFSGTFLLAIVNNNIVNSVIKGFVSVVDLIISSMADRWHAGIMLQVLCIGGVVALVTKMGGTKAIAIWLSKRAKTGVSAQISTWFMGLVVFFDDYANALIVGPIMKPITDKLKISREKLAFIIDATAAPVAGIAIISTWVGLEISLIKDGYELIGIKDVNAYEIFIQTIPYRFYNLFMLFFIVCTAVMNREYGPMLKAQRRAKNGEIFATNSIMQDIEDKTLEPKDNIILRSSNALIPILVLIIGAFISFYFNGLSALDAEKLNLVKQSPLSLYSFRESFGAADASVALFQSALFSSIIAMFMGIYRKIFTMKEAIETWIKGWKTMIITLVILLLAWSLGAVIKDLGTSKYLVDLLSDNTPKLILPVAIFILASFISFSTGTSYGTMSILMPLAIPLANGVGLNAGLDSGILSSYMMLNISAVLTGAIFGDHCSPISDTTILSSMGASCNHIDHVSTQFIYAISVFLISMVFGYIPVGLGLSIWIVLPLGFFATWAMVRFVGKKV